MNPMQELYPNQGDQPSIRKLGGPAKLAGAALIWSLLGFFELLLLAGGETGLGVITYILIPLITIPTSFLIGVAVLYKVKDALKYSRIVHTLLLVQAVLFLVAFAYTAIMSMLANRLIAGQDERANLAHQAAQNAVEISGCEATIGNHSAWQSCVDKTLKNAEDFQSCSEILDRNQEKTIEYKDFYNFYLLDCALAHVRISSDSKSCLILKNSHPDSELYFQRCETSVKKPH